jgi:hypothetical protein
MKIKEAEIIMTNLLPNMRTISCNSCGLQDNFIKEWKAQTIFSEE